MADDTPLTLQHARHLLRRTGFGASQPAAVAFLAKHANRGSAASDLLDFRPSGWKPGGRDFKSIHDKWISYMLKVKDPLQEKLVLFWHDHFATGISKVGDPKLMANQNRLFRLSGKGNLKTLVKAVNVDPAMMEFLDTVRNHAATPNENYARELQELFTLGVEDAAGNDTYTQADVAQIARAFTGWYHIHTAVPYFDSADHDYSSAHPERGPKTIYQSTGGFGANGRDFDANGEGEAEIGTVVDIIFAHTDTDGENTVARRTARRLIEYFAYPDPSLSYIDAVVANSGFAVSFDLTALLHQIFVHDDFYLTAVPPLEAVTPKSVRWPVDYVVASLRLLKMKAKGSGLYIASGDYPSLLDELARMGQVVFDPPSVFGWDWETAWISSSTILARYGFARDLTSARNGGGTSFRPEKLMDISLTDPTDILSAATDVLGMTGDLSAGERGVLVDYLTDNGTNPSLDLTVVATRHGKLHGLFGLLMQSPAYQQQ